jgi:LPS-assembly protein
MNPASPILRFCTGLLPLCLAVLLLPAGVVAQDSKQATRGANATEADCITSVPHLDWVGEEPQDEPSPRSRRCGGVFVDPLAELDTSQDPAQLPIEANANRSEMQGDMVRLSGGVEASQGYRSLKAEDAEFNRTTRSGTLLGDVEFREPGLLMRGATGSFNSETGEASLTAAQFVLHEQHVHGASDLIKRRADEIIELDDGSYSYCPPLQENWVLHAKNLELDLEEGVGTARDAKIEMGGIPVIYTPYLRFPLDDRRKSGFLWPELGKDSNGGIDFAAPYYFNLAPNYDATLTPRYIADRGLLAELELRHLSHEAGYWELGGAWISGDDEYQEDFPDEDGDRWLAAIEQHGLFKRRWRTEIDFTKTGDDEYFSDIGTSSLQVRQSSHLIQAGEVDYLGDSWAAQLRLEEFQTIARDVINEPYSKLPQLSLSRNAPERAFSPNLLLQSDLAYFDHDDKDTGGRLFNAIGASYPMRWIWGFLVPVAKYRQINYDLDDEIFFDGDFDDSPDVGAPLLSVDGGLFFERETSWGLQTLEPRLYYLWADFEEQAGLPDFDSSELTFAYSQLFRETRFSGKDRLDDANQVSVGLTTRFIDQDSADFEGSSAIAAEFNLAPADSIDFRSSWLWNTDEEELDQTYIQLGYLPPGGAIFNLGYSYRRYRGFDPRVSDIEQVDFSSYLPVNNEWALFLRSLYDIDSSERINDMAGIEYNSCCWRVRFVYQRSFDQKTGANVEELVEHDNAIFLEFQLKGLGGVGTRVSSLLEETIRGFRDSDE